MTIFDSPRARPWLLATCVALVALALYAPTWSFGTLGYDDVWLVRDNPLLRHLDAVTWRAIFFDLSQPTRLALGSEYLPLRDLSIAVDYALFGQRFGAFHATQTLFYALACGLLLSALWGWTGRLALALTAALVFATHPLHVESVAWLSERKGVLALFFFSLTLLAFRRFVDARGAVRAALWLALCALSAAAAVWSKGLAVAGLAVLLVLPLLFRAGPARRRGLVGVAILTGVVALAFVPVWVAGQRLHLVAPLHGGSFGATAALAAKAHALYLGRAALVGEAGMAYPLTADGSAPLSIVLGALGALVVLATLLYGLRRALAAASAPSAGAPWPALTLAATTWIAFLLPVSQLIFPLQNTAADRYTLLPTLGWAIAIALALERLLRRRLGQALLAALLVAQIASSLAFTQSWRSDEALYRQALRAHPRYLPALLQLSRLARERGAPREAEAWIQRAEHVAPGDYRVATHRALLAFSRGETEAAIASFRRASRSKHAIRARINLALLLLRRGQGAEALSLAREAAALLPLGFRAQHTLGVVALELGHLDEAERALRSALRLREAYAPAHYNLAVLALRRGHRERAAAALRRALQLAPDLEAARRLQRALRANNRKAEGGANP